MTENALQEKLHELAVDLDVPGVSAGVLADGKEHYAFHGVTSVENPLPVDETTLFQFGSTGKTFTATAIMRLVEQGAVDLAEPVRTYVPELTLQDEDVARRVTVLQLLNHTAGWAGDLMEDTGDGDDALEKYVANMARIEQVSPLGSTVSYNNASLSLAGHLIAKVTGKVYETAIRDLLLDPLGLDSTYFFPNEIISRRFAVGHLKHDDGRITVVRPWAMPRGSAPAGGMSANARDQIAWTRFHMGDGTAADGTRLLSAELLDLMKQPTADMQGSALGDQVGISWLLRDAGGVQLVEHGGTTNGQYSDLVMAPERNVAVITMANCGPNGPQLNHALVRWALSNFGGIVDAEPLPISLSDEALQAYVGRYETIAAIADITAAAGALIVNVELKPEARATMHEQGEEVPDSPPIPIALLAADSDNYVVPDGPAKGMKGYFTRDADGQVDGVHLGGRLARRVASVPA